MKIFLICPVRNATEEQIKRMKEYIATLESQGITVYYPARDNPYEETDKIGYQICKENSRAIKESDEIHIFWDKTSQGSLFDLGGAFMLDKPLVIVNSYELEITPHKSFANMVSEWSQQLQ